MGHFVRFHLRAWSRRNQSKLPESSETGSITGWLTSFPFLSLRWCGPACVFHRYNGAWSMFIVLETPPAAGRSKPSIVGFLRLSYVPPTGEVHDKPRRIQELVSAGSAKFNLGTRSSRCSDIWFCPESCAEILIDTRRRNNKQDSKPCPFAVCLERL